METLPQRHLLRRPAASEGGVPSYGRKDSIDNWRGVSGLGLGGEGESSHVSTVHRPSISTGTSGQRKASVQRGLAGGERTAGPRAGPHPPHGDILSQKEPQEQAGDSISSFMVMEGLPLCAQKSLSRGRCSALYVIFNIWR